MKVASIALAAQNDVQSDARADIHAELFSASFRRRHMMKSNRPRFGTPLQMPRLHDAGARQAHSSSDPLPREQQAHR